MLVGGVRGVRGILEAHPAALNLRESGRRMQQGSEPALPFQVKRRYVSKSLIGVTLALDYFSWSFLIFSDLLGSFLIFSDLSDQ